MEEFDFRWGGVALKYGNHENCTLEVPHVGVLESGVYKNGKVSYMDNVIDDFLPLVDLRKVGKGLGYNVDISNPKPNLEIWYRKGGTHGVGELELINSDAKLVDMLAQMPYNRIIVLYYTEVGNSNTVWSQASFGCQDSEEDDGEFVDNNYEFNEEEFGFKIVEVPVHGGAEPTMNGNNEGPSFEAPREVSSDGEHIADFDTQSEGYGMIWNGIMKGQVLKEALKEYSIIQGRWVYFEKNDKTRVNAICKGGLKCPFVVDASQINQDVQTFAIMKLSLEHTCGRMDKLKFANPKWIWDIFSSKINRNTDWNLKAFKGEVLESYHVRVSKSQVYRAKRLAEAQIEGNYIQQYARLWDYADQLKNTNKGPYPGKILTAVGVDGISNGLSWVFISDKQKGLIPTVVHVLPTAEHMMCLRHLYNKFRATHLGLTLKHMLWAAAKATTIPWWEAEMEKMKEENLEAWKWLVQRPPKNWTLSHFHPRYKCDLLLNDLCESFNAAIIDARNNSILTCLESIRMYVMLRMANRRATYGKWKHPIGPRIFKIIEKNNMGASQCIPRLAGEKMYQVCHMMNCKNKSQKAKSVYMAAMSPEHPGRVRGVGAGISPRQYFNLPKPQRMSFDDRLKDSLRVLLQEETKKMEAKAREEALRMEARTK
ncbi:hypothetical protein L3X38_033187 [Prunus dulcis]|uniref:Transposase MuDR plant domain-containing protein n=1 Tax=Prunus dulcis TaxID=3755 RepID=A0AAD4YWQ8_PRUDU|nr:hypothetical protein L3X38_033187 [Prunus dulcis]